MLYIYIHLQILESLYSIIIVSQLNGTPLASEIVHLPSPLSQKVTF